MNNATTTNYVKTSPDTVIKTVIVKSRGRKYFDCVIGGYSCKLVINSVSDAIQPDTVVTVEANDLSVRNKYGATLKFDPVAIVNERDAEQLRQAARARKFAERQIEFAEEDIVRGRYDTSAINSVSRYTSYEHLVARINKIIADSEINKKIALENPLTAKQRDKANRIADGLRARNQGSRPNHQRKLFPVDNLPPLNTPIALDKPGCYRVYTGYGSRFRITEDTHATTGYSEIIGCEGELACYCYYKICYQDDLQYIS